MLCCQLPADSTWLPGGWTGCWAVLPGRGASAAGLNAARHVWLEPRFLVWIERPWATVRPWAASPSGLPLPIQE